jgi:hypothetical protein
MLLSSLSSPNKSIREQAEVQYNTLLNTDPTSLASELCKQAHPDVSNNNNINNKTQQGLTSLALVLLRQLVKGEHYGRITPLAKQEMCDFLLDVVDRHPTEVVKMKAAEVIVAMPAGDLNEDQVITRCISFIRRNKDEVVVRMGLYIVDGLAEFAFERMVSSRIVRLAENVAARIDPTQFSAHTCLVALRTGCSLVIGCPSNTSNTTTTTTTSSADTLDPALKQLGEAIPVKAIETIAAALQQSNTTNSNLLLSECEKTLQSVALMTEAHAFLLDCDLGRFCSLLLEACESPSTPAGIKSLCLTNLAGVLARRGVSAVNDGEFCVRALRALLFCVVSDTEFITQHDAFSAPSEEDPLELQNGGPRGAAFDALQQFALAVSVDVNASKALLVHVFNLIQVMLSSQNWIERHAGFSTIAVIATPLEKRMWAHIQDVVKGCTHAQENDNEARVRAAASGCLSSILKSCPALGTGVRKSMHGIIIPSLARSLASNESRDTTYSRCSLLVCTLAFLDGPPPRDCVLPYMDGFTMALVNCLKSSQTQVQVKALEGLARLATAVGPEFARFYNDLIPSIKQVLVFLNAESELAKASMTCVAAIAECAGKERFTRDATEILGAILGRAHNKSQQAAAAATTAASGELAKDETLELEGLFEFVHRVCIVLEADFAPFVSHVLPLALRASQVDLGVEISETTASDSVGDNKLLSDSADQDEENTSSNGQFSTTISQRGVGTLNVSANVFAFQLRVAALKAIDSMADALGDKFSPQDLEACCQVVLANIENRLASSQINSKAAEAMGSLFHAACKIAQKNPTGFAPAARNLFVKASTVVLSRLGQDITVSEEANERRLELIKAFERFTRGCYYSGDFRDDGGEMLPSIVTAPPELLPRIIDTLLEIYRNSLTRRLEGVKELKSKGFDAPAVKEYQDFLETDEETFCTEVVDSLGYLLKADPINMFMLFQTKVLPFFVTFLQQPQGYKQHKGLEHQALCVFIDAMEYCPSKDLISTIMLNEGLLCNYLINNQKNPTMLQVIAYGLGIYAKQGVLGNAEGVATTIATVLRSIVIPTPNQSDEDNDNMEYVDDWQLAKDNVVSALGKVILMLNGNTRNEAIMMWLGCLPLQKDEAEAQFCHEMLCRFILQNDPAVMQVQFRNHVMQVVVACVKPFDSKYSDESQVDIAGKQVRQVLAPQAIQVLKSTCTDSREWQNLINGLVNVDDGMKNGLLGI